MVLHLDINEWLQLNSQSHDLTISYRTPTTISLNAFFGLMVHFTAVVIGIFWKRKQLTPIYRITQNSPLNSTKTFSGLRIYSLCPHACSNPIFLEFSACARTSVGRPACPVASIRLMMFWGPFMLRFRPLSTGGILACDFEARAHERTLLSCWSATLNPIKLVQWNHRIILHPQPAFIRWESISTIQQVTSRNVPISPLSQVQVKSVFYCCILVYNDECNRRRDANQPRSSYRY